MRGKNPNYIASVPLGRRRFQPTLWPSLATLALVPFLASLGIWQLDRADQKRALESAWAEGTDAVARPADRQALEALPRFHRLEMSGRYLAQRQFLLDNMGTGGGAGYHVLTPFRPDGADWVLLVDRGWVVKDFSSASLPEVNVAEDPRSLPGRTGRLPRPGLRLAATEQVSDTWPRVVQFPTVEALEEALGLPLADTIVLLDSEARDGFLRRWQPAEFGPERHIGYAVQWFALSLTVLIIFLVVNLRKPESTDD